MAKISLSSDIDAMRGKIGDRVYTEARNGSTVRKRVVGTNPNTDAQNASRTRFTAASKQYKTMAAANVEMWQKYSKTVFTTDPITGKRYNPAPGTLFNGLSAKFLQINPQGIIPLTPPTSAFAGDLIKFQISTSPGHIDWIASASNSPNVKTELLLQTLPSQNRMPSLEKYVHAAFVAFGFGVSYQLSVKPGIYAVAYRFVNTVTGQETNLVPAGVVTVS